MRTTITDVARIAKVSASTVSHVINGTKAVNEDTRRRVEDAVKVSNYMPHSLARSLRRGRTNTIGLVVSDTSQYVFGRIIAAIEHEIREAGFNLLLANSGEDREREFGSVQTFLNSSVDGIIIAPSAEYDPKTLAACDDAGVAYVLVDRTPNILVDQVGTDDRSGMHALTQHFIAQGHTDIALIAGDVDVWTLHERADAYRRAMADAGLKVDERAILNTKRGLVEGIEEIEPFLRARASSTAVIAASGLLTLGALHAFRRLGISVPHDLAFASYDGLMNAEFFEPRLTAILHPVDFIGQEATALLLRRITDPAAPPQTIKAQPILDHGTSCGCPAGTELTLHDLLKSSVPKEVSA